MCFSISDNKSSSFDAAAVGKSYNLKKLALHSHVCTHAHTVNKAIFITIIIL